MKVIDIIFALVVGRFLGIVVGDFLEGWGINIGFYQIIALWIALPTISLFCLWIAYQIGKKLLFIYQIAKHILVGAFATVIDLKAFELLVWVFSLFFTISPIFAKGISFMISTSIKYIGNKFWTFQKHEKENIRKEIFYFLCIISVGLTIDVSVFHYLTDVLGPKFAISEVIWIKISVLVAAIVAAIWNFLGDKFLVFKK